MIPAESTTKAGPATSEGYSRIRQRSIDICAPLSVEDHIPQPAVFVSPPKWHLAHSSWFFEQFILLPHLPGYRVFDERFAYLFNSYYNHVGQRVDRDKRGLLSRPSVKEVYDYRRHVDEQMCRLLDSEPDAEVMQLTELGLQHEQQHQELLITDIKYILGTQPFHPVYERETTLSGDAPRGTDDWIDVPAGLYEIGYRGDGFCFDNELTAHRQYLEDYRIAGRLVTNAEYMEFVEAGGYRDFSIWLDEGWAFIQQNAIEAPLYWFRKDNSWNSYQLSGAAPLDPDAAVTHLSFYEAAAYAEWRGMRLPTEFEWEAASDRFDWGQRWEWVNSAYLPYPGFTRSEGAIGEYNGKFMINQMVLRGASNATAPAHSRSTYRNFFHAQEQWQFSGIRLAK